MQEVWKPVSDYEGYYSVSNLGRVRGEQRVVLRSDGKSQTFQQKILSAKTDNVGYPSVNLFKEGKGKTMRIHKLMQKEFLSSGYIDHIDGDRANNNINNLRACSQSQNAANSKLNKNSTSGFKGVSWFEANGRWSSHITINGKKKHLGYFDDAREAARTYDKAANYFFGEFSRQNF